MKLLTICAALCFHNPPPAVLPLAEVSQEVCEDFMEGELGDLAIEIAANTVIPMQMGLSGDFVETEGVTPLRFKQTLYVRYDGEQPLFSTNGKRWNTFTEIATGSANIAFGVNDDGPFARLSADIHGK